MTGTDIVLLISAIATLTALSGLGWWLFRRAPTPREATWPEVESQARKGGYRLIGTEELAALWRRNPSSLLLVDTREPGEYAAGHIQGAVNFPLEPTRRARRRSAPALATLLGPDKERDVVFY